MILSSLHHHRRQLRRSALLLPFVATVLLLTAYTRRTQGEGRIGRIVVSAPSFQFMQNRGGWGSGSGNGGGHTTVTETVTQWGLPVPTFSTGTGVGMDQALEGHDDTHQHQQVPNQIGSLRSLETHTYREDGLVEVNPNGPHPIFKLIRDAEKAWERKHRRASRTLREVVREYKRRYMRDPPRGFDHWWSYVQKHNVQLPDEYDQIYHDLEPYWGMDPRDLQTMQSDWEAHADSYTLGKDKTEESIKLVNFTLPGNENVRYNLAGGGLELIELLEDVEKYIPPFRAVFSPHDNPNLPTDYELKKMALEAAKRETYIDLDNPPEVKLDGWISACPPSSPARLHPLDLENPSLLPPRTTKTFIHDHRLSMDPCLHPTHLLHHGQFLSHNKGPVPHRFMVPQFSYCPTMLHHDIMAAMPINWVQDILPRSTDPEWDAREDERLHWRGRNTGIWHAKHTRWHAAHRNRLVDWANRGLEGNLSLLLPRRDEKVRVGESVKVKKARYAPAMLDVAFVGGPISCEEGTCQEMEEYYEFRKAHDKRMEGRYKYVVDVDGNGWSSRFKRLITSNSLVFKSTVYPEWYTDRIEPWVHYVPIQVDYSDLFDALIFFRGGLDAPEDDANPNSNGAHEDLARKIARAGREWSLKYWRREDLTAYMFRLFLEYARVMSVNRKDEVFVLT